MKKSFLLSLFLLLTATGVGHAYDFTNPMDRDGYVPPDLQQIGVSALPLAYSTNPVGVQGATVAVYGVLTSSMPTGSEASTGTYCLIYSSNTPNFGTGKELLVPELRFSSNTRNTLYVFDPPVISPDGFSANITSAAGFATVFYRFLATNTPEDVWVPFDQRDQKAPSPQFYGVKAASNVVSGTVATVSAGTQVLDFTTTEKVYATDRQLLYGMTASSGTANLMTEFAVFRSTNITGSTWGTFMILPPILYQSFNGGDDAVSNWKTKVIRFPWPIIFPGGITVQLPGGFERFRPSARPARGLR